MLSQSTRLGLCQTCRNDLLSLFENGIGFPSLSRRVLRRPIHRTALAPSLRDVGAIRHFSSGYRVYDSGKSPSSSLKAAISDPDVNLVPQSYREPIEEIKQQPYKPKVGDVDEDSLEYTAERLDRFAHDVDTPEAAGDALAGNGQQVDGHHERHMEKGGLERRRGDDPVVEVNQDEQSPEDSKRLNAAMIRQGHEDPQGPDTFSQWSDLLQSEADQDDSGVSKEDTEHKLKVRNPVEATREMDGSLEDVAREARQLHGEYLPEGVLSREETKTYRRLYGDPLKKRTVVENPLDIEEGREPPELLDQDGQSIDQVSPRHEHIQPGQSPSPASEGGTMESPELLEQRAVEIAEQIGGEFRYYEAGENTKDSAVDRGHPLTVLGRFQTSPRTIFLPRESFVQPIQKILSQHSNKHVKEMSERLFGGPGLPDSPLTPRIGRTLPQKPIPLDASQHGMGTMEANAYISIIWPSTYAAVSSVLVETRKRLGSAWLRDLFAKEGGASVLDAGGGGVGILAWRDILKAEWEALHSSDASPPPTPFGKSMVLTGAENLRHRAAALLENTTFLPRLPDYVHVRDSATLSDDRPAPHRKHFDVIIAPHTLWPLAEEWQRKQHVQNLWSLLNPDGGVLVLVEKGVPRGFEVIAGAREVLLGRHIATADSPTYESRLDSVEEGPVRKGKGMIVAPCTNHAPCPMYTVPGVSRGRKDYCSFQQRYIRPPFLQHILGATDRNHDDVDFSFVVVQKGRDLHDHFAAREPVVQGRTAADSAFAGFEHVIETEKTAQMSLLTLPRVIYPPLKRAGHVTIDVCTPAGQIDRWTISKSFSKTAYSDARKVLWGDLWALGAKTRVSRNLQLGGAGSKKGKSPKERMMGQAKKILERVKEQKEEDQEMERESRKEAAEEDAMLNAYDIDFDAQEILRKIHGGKKRETSRPQAVMRDQGVRREGKARTVNVSKPTAQPPSSLQRSSITNKRPSKPITPRTPDGDHNSSNSRPQPQHRPPTNEPAAAPPPPPPPNPPTPDLTPSQLATIADMRAEARQDQLQNQAMDRLSSRRRRRSDPASDHQNDAWRIKMERSRVKKRERLEERAEKRVRREARREKDGDGDALLVRRGRGRGQGQGEEEQGLMGGRYRDRGRDTVEDVWGFDE